MKILKMDCPCCGASLKLEDGKTDYTCAYCGTSFKVDENDGKSPLGDTVSTEKQAGRIKRFTSGAITAFVLLTILPLTALLIFLTGRNASSGEIRLYEANFDPYSVITDVRAEGISGYGTLQVGFVTDAYRTFGRWEVSKEDGLSNGDEVTITFVPTPDTEFKAEGKWYKFSKDTIYESSIYIISGMDEYVTDIDAQNVPEDTFTLMRDTADYHIRDTKLLNLSSDALLDIKEVEYLGYVVRVKKDGSSSDFILLYRVLLDWYDTEIERFVPVKYADVIKTADGIIDCNYTPTFSMDGAGSGTIGRSDYFADPPVYSAYVYGFETLREMRTGVVNSAEADYDIYKYLPDWEEDK